jgi:hypothetical protein
MADGDRERGVNHTNFRLNRQGESVILTHYDGRTVLDSLTYIKQYKNSAFARIPGTNAWYSLPATPGKENMIPDYSGLMINEVMGYNRTIYCDAYNEYDDWIELYNGGDAPIDIGGMFLTDSLDDPTLFRISSEYSDSTTIPAGEHLILWADHTKEQGILHLGFNISKTGETLAIMGHDASLVDSVSYPFLSPNQSWGRVSDGDNEWTSFTVPTPEASNLATSRSNLAAGTGSLLLYPNPVIHRAIIQLSLDKPSDLIIEIIDSRGRVCDLIHDFHPGQGTYQIEWFPDQSEGGIVDSGLFLCRVRAGDMEWTSRFLVIRTH